MSTVVKTQKRDIKENAKLRNSGFIPAVVYGYQLEVSPLLLMKKILRKHFVRLVVMVL